MPIFLIMNVCEYVERVFVRVVRSELVKGGDPPSPVSVTVKLKIHFMVGLCPIWILRVKRPSC